MLAEILNFISYRSKVSTMLPYQSSEICDLFVRRMPFFSTLAKLGFVRCIRMISRAAPQFREKLPSFCIKTSAVHRVI